MRAAIVQLLRQTPAVTNVVADRIFERQGPYGGVSRDQTPDAFGPDGDLLPSLVVQMETRTVRTDRPGRDAIAATQTIAVFAMSQFGYTAQEDALRAVLSTLDGLRGLRPLDDTHVACAEIRWVEDTGALLDPALEVPLLASRYAAVLTVRKEPI